MENASSAQPVINHGFANVNGINLHYADAGKGDLVIFLHGFPEFWYSWRHQLNALAPQFHVVAPDLRGYNLSDKPANVEDYRLEVLAEDVIGLIDHFGARTAAIVGHDWGAGVAWAVAQTYPDRVSKLAVMQVPPASVWRSNMSLHQLLRSWYMFFFQLRRVPEWLINRNDFAGLDQVFKKRVARPNTFSAADIAAYKEALRKPGALTAAINYYRANVGRLMRRSSSNKPVSERLEGRIRIPTLFVFGEQDFAILPQTVKGIEKFIDAPYRELRIPDSNHWVQNEAAEEVNAALLEFLSMPEK
jgi:pimeloyl-ACP methyl ester carboxylesterase